MVKNKLNKIHSDNKTGQNRIAASVLKLADKNFDVLDDLINTANIDCRDISPMACVPTDRNECIFVM
jgi:hypothetical protein